jgi:hypothetical protein
MRFTAIRYLLIAALLFFVGCAHFDAAQRPDDDANDRVRERTR